MQSVNSIAQNLLNKYDKNYNGVIDLDSFNEEGSKDVRTVSTGYSQDVITVTRYSQSELFRRADRNNDRNVTRAELERYVSQYDRDRDGFLDDYDPWAGHYDSEKERFDNDNRETSYVVSREVINHYPNYPNYPSYPSHPNYPSHPGHPGYPNLPNHPGHPNFPNHPGHPNHPGGHPHNKKNDNDLDFKFKINIKL